MSWKDRLKFTSGSPTEKVSDKLSPKDQYKTSMEDIRLATTGTTNPYKTTYERHYNATNDRLLSYRISQVHKETSAFFETHLKSNTLDFVTDKVATRITSDMSVLRNGEVVSDELEFKIATDKGTKVMRYDLNGENWLKIVKMMYLYKDVTLWGDVVDGKLTFSVFPSFRTNVDSDVKARYYYQEDGVPMYAERVKDPDGVYQKVFKEVKIDSRTRKFEQELSTKTELDRLYVFELCAPERLVNMSTLDLILMYSEQLTTYQKEFKLTAVQIFAEQGLLDNQRFQELKSVWKRVAKESIGDGTSFGQDANPFYDVFSPEIRAQSLIDGLNHTEQLLANNLKLDKSTIGFIDANETATATLFKGSATVDTINNLKRLYETIFNGFVRALTESDDVVVSIRPFMLSDMGSTATTIKTLVDSGSISVKERVMLLNPTYDNNQVMTEVVKIKLENGIELFADEEKFAIENEIYIRLEGEFDGRDVDSERAVVQDKD